MKFNSINISESMLRIKPILSGDIPSIIGESFFLVLWKSLFFRRENLQLIS